MFQSLRSTVSRLRWLRWVLCATLAAGGASAQTVVNPPATVPQTVPLSLRLELAVTLRSPSAPWGKITLDESTRRLFVARRAVGVSVYNIDTLKPLAEISDAKGALAVAIAAGIGGQAGRGFTANGDAGEKSLTVFDLASFKTVAKVALDFVPASLVYDGGSQRLAVMAESGGPATSIFLVDPLKLDVVKKLEVATPAPGGMTVDGRGRLFVTLPDKDSVAIYNLVSGEALGIWPTAPCRQPGLVAFERVRFRLVMTCGGTPGIATTIDVMSGKVAASVRIGSQPGQIAVDSRDGLLYFASGAEATLTVVGARGTDRYEVLEQISTRTLAQEIAVDSRTGRVFMVAADVVRSVPPQSGGPATTRIVANSFTILVYRRMSIEP